MSDFVDSSDVGLGATRRRWITGSHWVQRADLATNRQNASNAAVVARLCFRRADSYTFNNIVIFRSALRAADFVIDTSTSATFIPHHLADRLKLTTPGRSLKVAQRREYGDRTPMCHEITLHFTLANAPIPVDVFVPIDPETDDFVKPRLGVAGLLDRLMVTASRSEVNFFLRK